MENNIIKNVILCSEGKASGHNVFLNKKFITDLVRLGVEKKEVKARIEHPNFLSDETFFSYVGKFKNIRKTIEKTNEGNRFHAVGDLHVSETTKNNPKFPNLFEYLFQRANESPDTFGCSIHFQSGNSYNGKLANGTEVTFATIKKLFNCDIVDDPAATEKFFTKNKSNQLNTKNMSFTSKIKDLLSSKKENTSPTTVFDTKNGFKIKTQEIGIGNEVQVFDKELNVIDVENQVFELSNGNIVEIQDNSIVSVNEQNNDAELFERLKNLENLVLDIHSKFSALEDEFNSLKFGKTTNDVPPTRKQPSNSNIGEDKFALKRQEREISKNIQQTLKGGK